MNYILYIYIEVKLCSSLSLRDQRCWGVEKIPTGPEGLRSRVHSPGKIASCLRVLQISRTLEAQALTTLWGLTATPGELEGSETEKYPGMPLIPLGPRSRPPGLQCRRGEAWNLPPRTEEPRLGSYLDRLAHHTSFCDLLRGGGVGRAVCGVYLQVSYVRPGTAEASRHLLLGCVALTFSQVSLKLPPLSRLPLITLKKLHSCGAAGIGVAWRRDWAQGRGVNFVRTSTRK